MPTNISFNTSSNNTIAPEPVSIGTDEIARTSRQALPEPAAPTLPLTSPPRRDANIIAAMPSIREFIETRKRQADNDQTGENKWTKGSTCIDDKSEKSVSPDSPQKAAIEICQDIKNRAREVIDFRSLPISNLDDKKEFFSKRYLENPQVKLVLSCDESKKKYQGQLVSQYRDDKSYPSKSRDLRPSSFDLENFCAHGTNLSSVVSGLIHSNKQVVPRLKAEKLGIGGIRDKVSAWSQRRVATLPVSCTLEGNLVFDIAAAMRYALGTAENKEMYFDRQSLQSDVIPAVVLGDGVDRVKIDGGTDALAQTDLARNSAYKRVNIRIIAIDGTYKELGMEILKHLGINDVEVRSFDELRASNHWPEGTGARICEEVRNHLEEPHGAGSSQTYRKEKNYPSKPRDLRPPTFEASDICAHGTNLTSVVSALIHSNSQVIPSIKAKKLGIGMRTGESHGTAPENLKYVSTQGLREAAQLRFNNVIHYARMASESHGGFLDKPILLSDEMPAVILGDGVDGTGRVVEGKGVWGEYRYKRVNIRMIAVEEFNKSVALDILRHLEIDDIKVCAYDELEAAGNEFQTLWEKGESIKKVAT